jgi:hypothetical protein
MLDNETITFRVTKIDGQSYPDDYTVTWRGLPIGRIRKNPGLPAQVDQWSWGCNVYGQPPRRELHQRRRARWLENSCPALSYSRLAGVNDQFFLSQKLECAVPLHIDGVSKIAIICREHGNDDAVFMIVGCFIDPIANRKLRHRELLPGIIDCDYLTDRAKRRN